MLELKAGRSLLAQSTAMLSSSPRYQAIAPCSARTSSASTWPDTSPLQETRVQVRQHLDATQQLLRG